MTIGNPDSYGAIGSACGYGSTPYTVPIVLFHRLDKWDLEAAFPPSPSCRKVPIPNATGSFVGPIGPVCVDKVTPGNDDCCSCTYSKEEYKAGGEMGNGLGQRAWAGGLFSMKAGTYNEDAIPESPKVCVVVAEVSERRIRHIIVFHQAYTFFVSIPHSLSIHVQFPHPLLK